MGFTSVRHLLSEVEGAGALLVAGRIDISATTLSLTVKSTPLAFVNDITAYRLAAGLYQVNIANFRGPQSIVLPFAQVGSSSTAGGGAGGPIGLVPLPASVGSGSYVTGTDTYSFVIGISSAGTFSDAAVNFMALAF